jgi:ABC-type glycerol-3-phosphate transport system permease component
LKGAIKLKINISLKPKKVNRSTGGNIAILSFILIFAFLQLITILFTIFSAFKPLNEIYLNPPNLYVINPTLNNFTDLFKVMNSSWVVFSRYIFNSLFVTTAGVFFSIIFASLAAYPLSKMKAMPGASFLAWFIILALMLSPDVSGITSFLIMNKMGMINTYFSIIIPVVASAFNVFLLKQFMEQMIPDSLIEAAKVDGANEITIWYRIVLPVIKPAIFTLVIFSMQSLWNNPGTTIYSEQLKTLPYAMQQIIAGGIARTGIASAIGVFILIVPVTCFVFFQSKVIETMSTSGIKD